MAVHLNARILLSGVTLLALVNYVTCAQVYVMSGDVLMKQPDRCSESEDCPHDFCCRNTHGDLIDRSGTFDVVGPVIKPTNGTCSPFRAQIGEKCSTHCPCETGLRCFRHLTGKQLVHTICLAKQSVEEEIDNFLICYNNPMCKLPI